jgi:anaerobic magnesium-protoporphyrin IX monomethyl ester cyclase
MQRRVDVDRVVQASAALRRRGIQVGMFIMLGYDGEEDVDLRATISHLKRSSPDIFLTTLSYPIKGTPYYAQVASRIRTDRPWTERSDRDLTVAGRRPRRYYDFARRWIVGEVDRHRHWHERRYVRSLRSASSAFIGRAGMKVVNALHGVERER